jgi:hypothetical protein
MSDRTRRWAITAGAVVLVLVGLAVAAPEIYTGTFSNAATLARVVALVLLLVGWAWLVRRLVRHEVAARVLAVAPAVVAAALLLWPYLRPATEVDEALPPAEPASDGTAPDAAAAVPSTTAPGDGPAAGAGIEGTPAPTTTAPPAQPVELRRASFQGLTGHRGSGDAVVYDLGGGATLLRFEEVDIGSGPALEVYLVPGPDQRATSGGTYVAPLTAERGNQNYEVPDGVDLTTGTWTVLVWCETFVVEVANATLA